MTGTHLSFLALDGIRLGRPQDAGERAHLANARPVPVTCRRRSRRRCPGPTGCPGRRWRSGSRTESQSETMFHRGRRPWFWLLALAPAAGAAALWLVAPRPGPRPVETPAAAPGAAMLEQGTREKGTPAVRVFVKRDDRVFVWDGKRAGSPRRSVAAGGAPGRVQVRVRGRAAAVRAAAADPVPGAAGQGRAAVAPQLPRGRPRNRGGPERYPGPRARA